MYGYPFAVTYLTYLKKISRINFKLFTHVWAQIEQCIN